MLRNKEVSNESQRDGEKGRGKESGERRRVTGEEGIRGWKKEELG